MTDVRKRQKTDIVTRFARLAVGAVFALNVECALSFMLYPGRYAGGFELAGVPGEAAVRGLGIAFLMWNATYPLVVWRPREHPALFAVVLAQQAIGVVGETWLLLGLPPAHQTLRATITHFILFDGVGLLVMAMAYVLLRAGTRKRAAAEGNEREDSGSGAHETLR